MASTISIISSCAVCLAVILHIICMATSYYSSMDVGEVSRAVALHMNVTMDEAASMVHGSYHFGVWKYCVYVAVPGPSPGQENSHSFCFRLGTETQINPDTSLPESLEAPDWLKATQALSIVGLLIEVMGAALLILHTVRPSKGERLHWFPRIILGLCVAGGIIILIGDIVFAHNHASLFLLPMKSTTPALNNIDPHLEMNVMELIDDISRLNWGFALDVFAALLCVLTGVLQMVMAWLDADGTSVVV